MNDEKLILLVQGNDIIYNKINSYYILPDKKRTAWTVIAKEMGAPEEMCSERWTSLRDRYVRENRQENLPSGSVATFKYRWPLMDTLEFLTPHVASHPMRSSFWMISRFYPVFVNWANIPTSNSAFLFKNFVHFAQTKKT